MSENLFQDMPLSDAQIQQDYALQKIKVVNDAVVNGSFLQGPDAGNGGDNPPANLASLNRRFVINVGGTNYYMYGSDIPAPP